MTQYILKKNPLGHESRNINSNLHFIQNVYNISNTTKSYKLIGTPNNYYYNR